MASDSKNVGTMKEIDEGILSWLRDNISKEAEEELNKVLKEEPERLSRANFYYL